MADIFFYRGVNPSVHTHSNAVICTINMCTGQSYSNPKECICAYYYGLMKNYSNTFNLIEIPIRQGGFIQGQGQVVCYSYESFLFQLSVTSW